MKLNVEKILKDILTEEYFKEFEVDDGVSRHPEGIGFNKWLERKGYIE